MDLTPLLEPTVDIEQLAATLDGLDHEGRVQAMRAWNKKKMAAIFEACAGRDISIEHLVPPGVDEKVEVIHDLRNTLPLFSDAQKRFAKLGDGKPAVGGFNKQSGLARASEPGYFVVREGDGEHANELVIDYREVPSTRPAEWPEIEPNQGPLNSLVWGGMVDYLRKVSRHVSMGQATKNGKPIGQYFALVRRDPPMRARLPAGAPVKAEGAGLVEGPPARVIDASMTATHAPGSINPADLKPLEPVKPSTPDDVKAVAERARAAHAAWAALPFEARALAAHDFGQKLLERADAAADLLSMETGRSPLECKMSELVSVAEYVKAAVRTARQALKPEKVKLSALDYPGKRAVIEPVARGVIGIIAPWNYPMGNFFKSFFPALLSGNAVVMKPSEFTPRSGAFLAQLAAEIFPKDLVGLVQGAGDVGAAVIENVDAVVFTGSVPTGRKVAVRAAERLIPCSVELGGKDAAIVLADCDLDRTAVGVAQWAIHNCGQNCAAIERVYVEEAIADRFVETLTRVVKKLRVAPAEGPTDLGPLQSEAQLGIVEKHVEEAKAKGAVVTCGGARTGHGLGYQPTVLDQCTEQMQVVRDETFGPVIAVLRVKDADEAVRRANDSRYGLNGSVWTKDLAKGETLARKLEVGVAYVNNHGFGGILAQVPWTGVKETGPGVAASAYSYGTYVRRRTVLVDGSKNPDPWWFPLNEDIGAFADALIARGRGGGLGTLLKLGGLVKKRTQAIRDLAK